MGAVSSCAAIGSIFPFSHAFQAAPITLAAVVPPDGLQARQGYKLYMMNCAHCHGTDARGDEGPDLHGITKSHARIASMIKNGIKGEMPKFGAKLTDSDVEVLIAYVKSLTDE